MEEKKTGFENKMKRLLIGFFVGMLLLTVISRAADSVTVGRVTVVNAERGELEFTVTGSGLIKSETEKIIRPEQSYIIGRIAVETGEKVNKGGVLFYYDMDSLTERLDGLEQELQKLKLDYERTGLSGQTAESRDTARELAILQVKNAREDYDKIKQEEGTIKTDFRNKKEKELKLAEEEKEALLEEKKSAVRAQKRVLEDAEKLLDGQLEKEQELKDGIKAYRQAYAVKDYAAVSRERDKLIKLYYGSDYDSCQSKVNQASKAVSRAKSDLEDIISKWNKIINEEDKNSEDEEVVKAYEQQVLNRDLEIKTAKRSIDDLQDTLADLMQEENEINDLLGAYLRAMDGDSLNREDSYQKLVDKFRDRIGGSGLSREKAETDLARAEEDYQALLEEWKNKEEKMNGQITDVRKVLDLIAAEKYDYSGELKDWEDKLEQASRVLESAELSLKQLEESEEAGIRDKASADKGTELSLRGIQLDIDNKQEEIEQIRKLKKENGAVKTPVDGMITALDIEEGMILSGQEKVAVAVDGYGVEAKLGREEIKNFETGDTITISLGKDKEITSVIEEITAPDEEDNVILKAALPEGDYKVNQSVFYTLAKTSPSYNQCVPIQALRQDSQGTYVLTVIEKEGILGREKTAYRTEVKVLDKDSKNAAVEGALAETDQIITGSSKNIAEGDRVRIEEQK